LGKMSHSLARQEKRVGWSGESIEKLAYPLPKTKVKPHKGLPINKKTMQSRHLHKKNAGVKRG